MRILGLDLSTVCSGFSIIETTAPTKEATQLLRYGVIEPFEGLSESEKYFMIAHQVDLLIRLFKPDCLVIEDTFYSKDPTVLKKLNRLAGHIQAIWFKLRRMDAVFYMAVSARKTLGGLSGKAKKEEIVVAVNQFFGLRGRLKDHNSADAVVIAYHHAMTGAFKKAPEVTTEPTLDPIEAVEPPSPTDFCNPIVKEKKRKQAE
jgi:Holliday junction resolvasome RuvABC endonuclease subunit